VLERTLFRYGGLCAYRWSLSVSVLEGLVSVCMIIGDMAFPSSRRDIIVAL
jgi:hypothetical protein